ncbi:hypothetical protein [Nostoc sp. KVJ3]|nr:hypothetical protein [Nostoc sp. KVJ3]
MPDMLVGIFDTGILAGGAGGEILLVAKSSRFREQRRNSLR